MIRRRPAPVGFTGPNYRPVTNQEEADMLSGLESPMHLLIVLIVAVLVLGPKKLPEVGRSLGSGIRQFKDSIEGTTPRHPPTSSPRAE